MNMDSEGKEITYEDAAKDWGSNPNERYRPLVEIEDLPIVLAIPDLKAYAWCQCNLVADDGSESHYHWHGIKFSWSEDMFKKIKCLDHVIGVLRYVACKGN